MPKIQYESTDEESDSFEETKQVEISEFKPDIKLSIGGLETSKFSSKKKNDDLALKEKQGFSSIETKEKKPRSDKQKEVTEKMRQQLLLKRQEDLKIKEKVRLEHEELKKKIKKKLFKERVKDEVSKKIKEIAVSESSEDGESTSEETISKPVRKSSTKPKTVVKQQPPPQQQPRQQSLAMRPSRVVFF